MAHEALEIILSHNCVSAEDVWLRIFDTQTFSRGDLLALYDRPIKASAISAELSRLGEGHFDIRGEQIAFRFSPIANFQHCLLEIQPDVAFSTIEREVWIKAFTMPALVSGRVYDVDYEYWQNAEDPLEYTLEGRSYTHLRTFRDPVFGDERIDTSSAPGRRVLNAGYVEAVGSMMWLTGLFEERTGAKLAELERQEWCRVTRIEDGVFRIQTMESCFASAEGREKLLQDKLRASLFPTKQSFFGI